MRPHLLVALLLVACGGSTAGQPDPVAAPVAGAAPESSGATADPPPGASSSPSSPSAASPLAMPRACVDKSAEICTPSSAFVERLCSKPHQDVALTLFAGPFSRMYLRGKLDELVWDEEVLALRFHGVPKNGIQVGSASGTYDVLRWDGSCSMAVEADMLTKNKPARPKTAKVKWHRIGDKTQTALLGSSEAVKRAYKKRGAECKGAMTGDVSTTCEKADDALIDAVVEYVRGGGSFPSPDGLY